MINEQDQPAHIQLATMSRWYVVSRALHTVARLGIANFMSVDTPTNVYVLAEKSQTKPEILQRLMTFLTSYNIFFAHSEEDFSLTPLSAPLRDDDPHSLRDVLLMVDETWWTAFAGLDQCLKDGKSGFFHQHQDDFFTYLGKHPAQQANFDRGMAKLSTYDDKTIANVYNFGQYSTIVDMGGGRGGLARAIHQSFPQLNIILFDTAQVIDQLMEYEFPSKIQPIAGDFLKEIPPADAYLFKGVLHDFNDELMGEILKNCHKRMPSSATLLIAEQVLPVTNDPHPNKTMDIVMLTLLAGRQRTLAEWQKCIEPFGFRFSNQFPTSSLFTLMEFERI